MTPIEELARTLAPTDDAAFSTDNLGGELHRLIGRLYPICRSLTGDGNRQTLSLLRDWLDLEVHEVPSGTRAFDWIVPPEWNIRDAYVKDSRGRRVIDFSESNLHVIAYSKPIHERISRAELLQHVHTDPQRPDWIPFRNSYYEETWGFCMRHRDLHKLDEPEYEVMIDSTLAPGSLTYAEAYLPGDLRDEILVSTHICHPSLCNDNLSGIAVAAALGRFLKAHKHRHSVRLLFVPCTIGPIVWLSRNEETLDRIKHGLVLACLGDPGNSTYVRSRKGGAPVDRAAEHVLQHSGAAYTLKRFEPYGYDQRQYCSPAFDLPVGCFMRTPDGCFPEYHTSADDLGLVRPDALADSFWKVLATLLVVDNDVRYDNLSPKGEPRLGPYGLYAQARKLGLMWILNYSDGRHSLLDIAQRAGMPFHLLHRGAQELQKVKLLAPLSD